mmetsp:Transcript_8100/g.14196  ORF Transcript_8100/g.14196 Transcript_8100/m.14196 type:complete len:131 (+) Transcript_8100:100-492(+)
MSRVPKRNEIITLSPLCAVWITITISAFPWTDFSLQTGAFKKILIMARQSISFCISDLSVCNNSILYFVICEGMLETMTQRDLDQLLLCKHCYWPVPVGSERGSRSLLPLCTARAAQQQRSRQQRATVTM